MEKVITIPKLDFNKPSNWNNLHIENRLLNEILNSIPQQSSGSSRSHSPLVWYRYIPFETLYDTIENDKLFFSYPQFWDDPFESLMLDRKDISCKCFCSRSNENEDAGWSVYASRSKTTPVVRYSIDVIKFLDCLNNYCTVNGNVSIYIGKVDYSYSRKEISYLISNQSKQSSLKNLLTLLLLKRPAFAYENEIRIFVVDTQYKTNEIDINSVGVDFADLIGRVTLPPLAPSKRLNNKTYSALQKIVNGGIEGYFNGRRVPIKTENSGLYRIY